MSTDAEVILIGALIGALSLVAVFCESPAWMVRLFERLANGLASAARAVTYRGHHRPDTTEEKPVLVAEVEARLEREARLRAIGAPYVQIIPNAEPFSEGIRAALAGLTAQPFDWRPHVTGHVSAKPEQLGALSL